MRVVYVQLFTYTRGLSILRNVTSRSVFNANYLEATTDVFKGNGVAADNILSLCR